MAKEKAAVSLTNILGRGTTYHPGIVLPSVSLNPWGGGHNWAKLHSFSICALSALKRKSSTTRGTQGTGQVPFVTGITGGGTAM